MTRCAQARRGLRWFLFFALAAPMPLVPQTQPDSILFRVGARVQVLIAHADTGWLTTTIGSVGRCPMIVVPAGDPESPTTSISLLPLAAADSLRISSLYDGRFVAGKQSRRYTAGRSLAGEEWITLSPGELSRAVQDASACYAEVRSQGP